MAPHCYLCGTTDRTKFHSERTRCVACRRAYDAARGRRSPAFRTSGHMLAGRWYPFVHLCPGAQTCAVLDVLTRQFIREQQP